VIARPKKGTARRLSREQSRWGALFTNHFGDGFVLTLRSFERRLLPPREKTATTAATSEGAQCAMAKARTRRSKIAIDPVETGFLGAGMSRETQS
jgi:hypothetical protein